MEDPQNDALIDRVPSTENMILPKRNSNAKAIKVASLTVLACLLLAGQAFTAYYVMGQKDHLKTLEQGQESLKKELTRKLSAAPKMMHNPMSKMPLLMGLDEDSSKTEEKQKVPLTRLQAASQREGSGVVYEGSRVSPKRMAFAMNSMPLLSVPETSEIPESVVETKCEMDAGKVMPGFFKPECDEEGNFKPMQCWHSTGYCWCVDKNGKEIPDTLVRGRPKCGDE